MSLQLLPDAEAFLSAFLRAQPELTALVGERVYTIVPETKTWPLVRLTRVGGTPEQVAEGHAWADSPAIQVDAWGERKAQAWDVARTIQAAVWERLKGSHPDRGVQVLGVELGPVRYLPDPTFTPAQPRVTFSLGFTLKTQGVTP